MTVSLCSLKLKLLSLKGGAHSSLSPSHSGHTDGGTVCLPTDTPLQRFAHGGAKELTRPPAPPAPVVSGTLARW